MCVLMVIHAVECLALIISHDSRTEAARGQRCLRRTTTEEAGTKALVQKFQNGRYRSSYGKAAGRRVKIVSSPASKSCREYPSASPVNSAARNELCCAAGMNHHDARSPAPEPALIGAA
ncbi:hypothetical protein KCP70_08400 [Salmonella enterica subsp. enterica]|nr:hypothetical protein KCP70_08400 [Salmonella enterica subsp. enterica]